MNFINELIKSMIPEDIKDHMAAELEKGFDQVRANIILQKLGLDEKMNTGLTEEEAKMFIKVI